MTDREARGRIGSVDELRGLAVLVFFATTCGARCVYSLPRSDATGALRMQLRPAVGSGFTLADLCFPMFLIVAGISLVLSWERRRNAEWGRGKGECGRGNAEWGSPPSAFRIPHSAFWRRSLARGLVLFGIGVVVQTMATGTLTDVVWWGPLGRLAVCIVLGGILTTALPGWRSQLAGCAALLTIYGGLLGGGIANPIPSLAILLGGCAMGQLVIRPRREPVKAAVALMLAGVAAVNLGFVVNRIQAWNPHVGGPSFSLVAMGLISLLFSLLLACGRSPTLSRAGRPLRVLGRNSLLSAVVLSAAPLSGISRVLASGEAGSFLGVLAPVGGMLIALAGILVPARLLDRRGIFLTPSWFVDRTLRRPFH